MRKQKPQRAVGLELSHGNQLLRSLWEISQSLYQYLNIDDLISNIIKRITGAMRVEAVSVILLDEGTDELVFCSSSDMSDHADKLCQVRFASDQGIAGSVLKSGRAEIILDVLTDPRHYKQVDSHTQFTTQSMIAVPLKTQTKTIGVLEALNKKNGVFDQEDLDFLVTLAPIVAMALDNARMYTELDSAYKRLQQIDKGKTAQIKQTKNELALLRREVESRYRFDKIIGNSRQMLEVFTLCEKVIDSDITVLIEGETGTGKELIARTIHYNGPRKNRPFVTQNCGGIPDTLLASELFGHKRGAFTGAFAHKKGLFEIAHGGTVFLDEVGEMSPAMQTSLLRVLQEGEIKPLGSERSKKVNIRLISATNKDLTEEMREGRLREDLFYRISVFVVKLPPLRERLGDISVLANHFVRQFSKKSKEPIKKLSHEALECLSAYPFPGNVRELENEVERAIAMAGDSSLIEMSNFSESVCRSSTSQTSIMQSGGSLKEMVEKLEKTVLSQTIEKHHGNKSKAARELGLSRNGLMKKIQRYNL